MPRKAPLAPHPKTSQILTDKVLVKPVTLRLPPLHPRQFEFVNALDANPSLRFICAACGTKFGKTHGSAIAIVQRAWRSSGTTNWWVAPTFSQSKYAYSLVKKFLPRDTFDEYKADLRIVLRRPDGSEHSFIEFKSADNPDSLRGYAVDFFVMDEAARCPYDSAVSILTTVTQTMGKGFFISTPHARNWFYDFYSRGEKFFEDGSAKYSSPAEDEWAEWFSMRMPTWTNPHVPLDSVRHMKKNLPEDVFRQEVAAQFLEDSAGVFRGVKDCIKGVLQPYESGHRYIMGVDLAKLKDYTVLTVMDAGTNHVVYHDRFNKISWETQYHKIIQVARQYKALAVMDSTGIGDPIVETIRSAGIPVEPYKISGPTAKQQLIEKLKINIEQQRISFPDIQVLRRELQSYEYKINDGGRISYSAPTGQHDDCVISLALANWMVSQPEWIYRFSQVRGI